MVAMTRILTPDPESIAASAEIIRSGGLVAFPTETVYGLGANAMDAQAVARIFAAKGRPASDPLIVHISRLEQVERLARNFSPAARTLAEAFWPGPLTLILPRQPEVPSLVTSGLDSVAVRIPDHPVALSLIEAAETPIAAPSANRFGHTSPTTAAHVYHDLAGKVDIILDGGSTKIGVESTVLDISTSPVRILRPGGVTREMIEALIGPVSMLAQSRKTSKGLPSPGLLKKHYAPRTEMILFKGPDARKNLFEYLKAELALGKRPGVMAEDEEVRALEECGALVFPLGAGIDLAGIASHIYAGMRWLDDQKVDVILCTDFGDQGLGVAIRDRLTRAATRVVG